MAKYLSDYTLEYENPALTWNEIVQIMSGVKPVLGRVVAVDSSTQDDAAQTFLPGNLKELDQVSFVIEYDQALTSHAYLVAQRGSTVNFRTTTPQGSVYTQQFLILSVDVGESANNAPGLATVTMQAMADAAIT